MYAIIETQFKKWSRTSFHMLLNLVVPRGSRSAGCQIPILLLPGYFSNCNSRASLILWTWCKDSKWYRIIPLIKVCMAHGVIDKTWIFSLAMNQSDNSKNIIFCYSIGINQILTVTVPAIFPAVALPRQSYCRHHFPLLHFSMSTSYLASKLVSQAGGDIERQRKD